MDPVTVGKLQFGPVSAGMDLVGEPVRQFLQHQSPNELWVTEIDPDLADTAAFCAHYDIGLDSSANCVIVEARRAERTWHAACVVLATTRADVNGIVRKWLDARRISFAAMDDAVALTGMEYGGITPIGLPKGWRLLISAEAAEIAVAVIGSGVRRSKLVLPGALLADIPGAEVVPDLALR
jgi:prolyl-tRNA editing enzyme YbaK/EbsC (Cys-tRNA(Pro) deacylase)